MYFGKFFLMNLKIIGYTISQNVYGWLQWDNKT